MGRLSTPGRRETRIAGGPCQPMSAFGGKADIEISGHQCPLMTHLRHHVRFGMESTKAIAWASIFGSKNNVHSATGWGGVLCAFLISNTIRKRIVTCPNKIAL